jgi:hypothetical protein
MNPGSRVDTSFHDHFDAWVSVGPFQERVLSWLKSTARKIHRALSIASPNPTLDGQRLLPIPFARRIIRVCLDCSEHDAHQWCSMRCQLCQQVEIE